MKKYIIMLIVGISFLYISGLNVDVYVSTSGGVPTNSGHIYAWISGGMNTHFSQSWHGEDHYLFNVSGTNYFDTVEAEAVVPTCYDHKTVPYHLPITNIHLHLSTSAVQDDTQPNNQ